MPTTGGELREMIGFVATRQGLVPDADNRRSANHGERAEKAPAAVIHEAERTGHLDASGR